MPHKEKKKEKRFTICVKVFSLSVQGQQTVWATLLRWFRSRGIGCMFIQCRISADLKSDGWINVIGRDQRHSCDISPNLWSLTDFCSSWCLWSMDQDITDGIWRMNWVKLRSLASLPFTSQELSKHTTIFAHVQ